MTWREMEISGWGRSSTARVRAARPERPREIEAALAQAKAADKLRPRDLIARGGGRAYGDSALNDGGHVLLTTRLNRLLGFDPRTAEVVCEPGISFADLLATFLPRGLMVPASPGTAFATVGGAVAADVHGKNHDRHGSFGDHVRWFELLLADGTTRRVSADTDPELFAATIGGMGLTGLLRSVCFRLLPGARPNVTVREQRMASIDHFLTAFTEIRETATFSVGWIDALARGASLGRGVLETAEFAAEERPFRPRKARAVPVDVPHVVLNRWSIRAFNELYFRRVPTGGRERLRSVAEFLYPLDSIRDWNRIYGRRGFYQFQAVIPDVAAPVALRQLLETIAGAGKASFLAVLKTLGRAGRGYLSFPIRGHTLALDFPRGPGTDELLRRLEAITLDHGGRIYLAKDALLSPASLRAMYPGLPQFEEVLRRVDPDAVFTSDQARRLGLKPPR
ncbi:MAG TPA: FAD-binding oxidoreductase [Alphaproteobacteria bacterium]